MLVYGKSNIRIITFEDLERCDIFCISSDINDEKQVYMKCHDQHAVNLETGSVYNFDKDAAVVKLDGELHINGIVYTK